MQKTMQSLERQLGELNVSVDARITNVENRVENCEVRVAKLEDLVAANEVDAAFAGQLMELQTEVDLLRGEAVNHESTENGREQERACTAVIGSLSALADLEQAETWLRDKLWACWAPSPIKVYIKGDYKNLV